jgi:thiol-disulfide isomerase/thioredoxin
VFLTLRMAACTLLLACALPAAHAQPARPAPLHDVRMTGLNGPPRQLASFRGRPLLINVWASWCEPCRAEMASLERLAWRDEARGFAIIGVSTDDYPDRAREWLKRSNATISHYIDHDLELETLLGASRLPLTVLVDARGVVIQRIYGARDWDDPESLALIRRAFGPGGEQASAPPH